MSEKKKPAFTRTIRELPCKRIKWVAVDTFTLPSELEGVWESLYFPTKKPTILVAPLTSRNTLILVQLFRFPTEEFVFNLPGGAVEDEEDFVETARRELLEETGYAPLNGVFEELTKCWIFDGKSNAHAIMYGARDCVRVAEPSRDEVEIYTCLETVEQTPNEIFAGIARGDAAYVPCISHALIALLGKKWINL